MQSQREILKIKSLCRKPPSQPGLSSYAEGSASFPGRLKLLQQLGWSRDGASVTGQCVPARSLQVTCSRTAREQQPIWAAQASAVPPIDLCHLWWPVERRGLLITQKFQIFTPQQIPWIDHSPHSSRVTFCNLGDAICQAHLAAFKCSHFWNSI